jgi:acyl dehydratase
VARFVCIPDGWLGREFDLGTTAVTAEMIAEYAEAVGDVDWQRAAAAQVDAEAPPTFCLSLFRGMQPPIEPVGDVVVMYGGHDIEMLRPIRAGEVYRVTARITDVYEKSGRSGVFNVVIREAVIRNSRDEAAVRVTERQVVRPRTEPNP